MDTIAGMLFPIRDVTVQLPATVGDFTDFYAGVNHAMNVGKLFRPDNPLLPNYKWIPIGYHGRASSVHVSGENSPDLGSDQIRRCGSARVPTVPKARSGTGTRNLDRPLATLPVTPFHRRRGTHIAGYCLLNDWSARDIQSWEYQPLGPFLSKNFHSSVSAWVITPEALTPYRTAMTRPGSGDPYTIVVPRTTPTIRLPAGLDIELEVLPQHGPSCEPATRPPERLSLDVDAIHVLDPCRNSSLITPAEAAICAPVICWAVARFRAPRPESCGFCWKSLTAAGTPFGCGLGGEPHIPRRRRRSHPPRQGPSTRGRTNRLRRMPGPHSRYAVKWVTKDRLAGRVTFQMVRSVRSWQCGHQSLSAVGPDSPGARRRRCAPSGRLVRECAGAGRARPCWGRSSGAAGTGRRAGRTDRARVSKW